MHAAQGISLWLVLYAPVVGPALGKVITRLTGGKRGPVLAGTVCGGLIVGASVVAVLEEMWRARLIAHMPPELAGAYAPDPTSWAFLILFLLFATGGAWWWLK